MSSIGQPVPELPVVDVERAQQHYKDALGFDIGWLYPGKEIGAVSRGKVASGANIVDPLERKSWGLRQFTVKDLDGNLFYFHHD
jgi:hypothetical protein